MILVLNLESEKEADRVVMKVQRLLIFQIGKTKEEE